MPVMSFEDAPIDISPVREEAGLNESPSAIENCPFPKCTKMYRRPQEVGRHIREHHLPHDIYCQRPDCNWTGSRCYALRNHLEAKHSGAPMPEREAFMIYDSKRIVKQLLNNEINVEQAMGEAQSLFQEKAV